MAERIWTKDQLNAINARGGTLLLSAAAGSGKTAVLVERIITLLTEGSEPVRPSELLVVTFTNAAAAEMRMRIAAAVDGLISKEPTNNLYRKIKMTLPDAEISTIDSFCIKLVRENFHNADIDPDFTILDNSEQKILISEAMEKTLDTLCSESPDIYDMLNSVTSYGKDDSSLSGKIFKLYNFSLSHPFPDLWLRQVEAMYCFDGDIKESVWGKIIIDKAVNTLEFCVELLRNAAEDSTADEVVSEKYYGHIFAESERINGVLNDIKTADWDTAVHIIRNTDLPRLPTAPRGYGSNPVKVTAESKYKRAKELLNKLSSYFCADSAEHCEDMTVLQPVIKALASAVREFGKNYDELKKERSAYTFGDIMHKALELLAYEEKGKIKKSSLAYELQQHYREILIDEYQDTNEAQDMLFATLSRDNTNLFTVGDVKQSIYRFRLAMPEIFVAKSREYTLFDGENYPAKIILGKNFRSRKGILDNINFLFKNLMSEYAGEMEYTDEDALYFGGGYPEDEEPAVELRFVQGDGVQAEAEYVAGLIKNMLDSGAEVTLGDGSKRPARPSDFCILLRSLKNKSEYYEKALNAKNIKAGSEKKSGLFDSTEVRIFMSLLKIISNPTDDISMLSVMFSPLYGFTADELAVMKKDNKKAKLYTCIKNSAETNEKSKKLFADLKDYRRMSAVMPVDAFLRTILELTGFLSVVGALKNGGTRKMNLIMLTSLASTYVSNGGSGLDGFIRFVTRAAESGADIPSAGDASSDADVVKIYSIHKSKGLEFPFVILADCAKSFNKTDSAEDMIISPSAGVGMVIINSDKHQKYTTLSHTAAKIAVERASASEELRILYVAMTRAKEKLIAVSTVKDIEKAAVKAAVDMPRGKKTSPGAVLAANSVMQWLLLGFMRHPDMHSLASICGVSDFDYKNAGSRLSVIVDSAFEDESEEITQKEVEPKPEIIKELREKAGFVYPYVYPDDARPKRVASDFEDKTFSETYFASSKPSFLNSDKLTAAEKGTANHIFMQNLDFNTNDVKSELERMLAEGILTKETAEVVRLNEAEAFLSSELCKRIRNADAVYREKDFTVQVPLKELHSDASENVGDEKVLILGKADLVFVENGRGVIVDYKTDRSKTREQFVSAYSGQLKMYAIAMEQLLGVPVTESVIYSLSLEEGIEV